MGKQINLPPAPRQDDTEAMTTWYSRVRDAILKVGQVITWSNLDFTGSNITDIVTRNHNDLQNIQGGSSGQRYHLTSAEYTGLQALISEAYGSFSDTTNQTVAAINTPTVISFDTQPVTDGITLVSGTQVTVPNTGIYAISFSVQITSTSSSAKNLWFWPRVNGSDIPGSTIMQTITNSSTTMVVSRNGLFPLTAGDYVEAWWAADSLNITLEAAAATAFSPATPSVTLAIHQVA